MRAGGRVGQAREKLEEMSNKGGVGCPVAGQGRAWEDRRRSQGRCLARAVWDVQWPGTVGRRRVSDRAREVVRDGELVGGLEQDDERLCAVGDGLAWEDGLAREEGAGWPKTRIRSRLLFSRSSEQKGWDKRSIKIAS